MMRERREEGAKVTTSLWAVLACAWSWCPGGCVCVRERVCVCVRESVCVCVCVLYECVSWCPGGCECVCTHMCVLTILCLAHRTPLRSELTREGLVGPLAAGGGLHKSSQQALEDQVAAIL